MEEFSRAELTATEIAKHTARRKQAWEMKETRKEPPHAPAELSDMFAAPPEPNSGTSCPTIPRGRGHPKQFAADTAERTGQSKRDVNRAVSRGEKIAPDVLDAVTGTANDGGARITELPAEPKFGAEGDGRGRRENSHRRILRQ